MVFIVSFCVALTGRAEDAPAPPALDPEPVGWSDAATIGAGLATALATNIAHPRAMVPSPRLAFDEGARDALRLRTSAARFAARDISDLTLGLMMIAPIVGDAGLNALWYRKNPKAAWRMTVVGMEAFAVTTAVQGLTHVLFSRERPYVRTCGTDLPADSDDCVWDQKYRSFYSGHSSFSFTGAALLCWQHLRYGLFGGGGAEAGTCAAGFTFAAATALLRMMGDMHYATDVIVGAFMGTAIGFLVPVLHEQLFQEADAPKTVRVSIVPTGTGVSVVGTF